MAVEYQTVPNAYQDSVKLMRVSSDIVDAFDVIEAVAVMGTEENKQMLVDSDLLSESTLEGTDPNDLILAVRDSDSERAQAALEEMQDAIRGESGQEDRTGPAEHPPRTIQGAVRRLPDANLALISVPGEFATREGWKALHEGLHVHLFSDGVSAEAERELKSFGADHDQLVMGPDCGSAIINGVPLGFANEVADGGVGVAAAAGTGLQEVTTLVDRAGAGISQAIGTGGRDLKDEIGGITMKQGLRLLASDEETDVILLVSKPPDQETMDDLLAEIREVSKPVVVSVIGGDQSAIESADALPADSLKDGAATAVQELPDHTSEVTFDDGISSFTDPAQAEEILADHGYRSGSRTHVRGLFSGGTLCYEAIRQLEDHLPDCSSNVGDGSPVADPLDPEGSALVDLGVDELTRGRPHPMIDTGLRTELLEQTLANEDVLVVLLDVVLGYGAHSDPAGHIAETVSESETDERPIVVASVCGTRADPQGWDQQIKMLVDAGVHVCESNVDASQLTANIYEAAAGTGGDSA